MKRTNWKLWAAIALISVLVARTIDVQNSLDCELIAALKRLDGPAVRSCLARGANPNATAPETRQLWWWRALAHFTRQQPEVAYDGDAALLVVFNRCIERENRESANPTTGAGILMSIEPTDIVRLLLDKGANANAQMDYGGSAIALAQSCGYKTCVRMLLEHGAWANGIAVGGGTLLSYAIGVDDFDTVCALIKHGADVNATGTSGTSPLAYAISSGSFHGPIRQRIIKFLTESGAHR